MKWTGKLGFLLLLAPKIILENVLIVAALIASLDGDATFSRVCLSISTARWMAATFRTLLCRSATACFRVKLSLLWRVCLPHRLPAQCLLNYQGLLECLRVILDLKWGNLLIDVRG